MTGQYKRGIYHTNNGFVHIYPLRDKWLFNHVTLSFTTDMAEELSQEKWEKCVEVNDLNVLAGFTRPTNTNNMFRICDGTTTCLRRCSAKKVPNSSTWISTSVISDPRGCVHSEHVDGVERDCTYTSVFAKLKI